MESGLGLDLMILEDLSSLTDSATESCISRTGQLVLSFPKGWLVAEPGKQ